MSAVQWGDIPSWIAAIGTAGAFIFAAIVFWYDLRNRRREDRKSQARLVDAWVTEARIGRYGLDSGERAIYATFAVVNASNQAIRRAGVMSDWHDESLTMQYFNIVPPTGNKPKIAKTIEPPYPLTDTQVTDIPEYMLESLLNSNLEMTFTDAAGYDWARDKNGKLTLRFSPSWLPKDWKPGKQSTKWNRIMYAIRRHRDHV